MQGGSFLSRAREIASSAYSKAKALASGAKSALGRAYDIAGSEGVVGARNLVSQYIGKNPLSRPLYPGERHLSTLNGSNYNFAGPGTQFAKRVARRDPPINDLDALAFSHDQDYSRRPSPAQELASDERLIAGAKKLAKSIPESALLVKAMQAKVMANKAGALPYGSFEGAGVPGFNLVKQMRAMGGRGKKKPARKMKGRGPLLDVLPKMFGLDSPGGKVYIDAAKRFAPQALSSLLSKLKTM